MRYWVFQNNQVDGPYEPQTLGELPYYSAEALVCSEGRRGTTMDDWQRAGMVPELAASLLKASSASGGRGESRRGFPGLPPEPTLKDLAVLGTLQEKCASLETGLKEMQERLEKKDAESADTHNALRKSLAEKDEALAELQSKLAALRTELVTAQSLEHDLEATLNSQRQSLSDLTTNIESLKTGIKELERKSEAPAPRPMERPSVSATPVMSVPTPFGGASAITAESLASYSPKPVSEPSLPPVVPLPLPTPSPIKKEIAPPGPEPSAPEKPKSKKAALLAAAALVLSAGGGYWMFMAPAKKPAPVEPPPEASPIAEPQPEPIAPPVPVVSEEELKATALEVAKSFPTNQGKPLSDELDALGPPSPGISPWQVEKIKDGQYQVNYFGKKSLRLTRAVTFEFEVQLPDKRLSPRNAQASAVITGQSFDGLKAPKRKVRVKPKAADTGSAADSEIGQIFDDLGASKAPAPSAPSPEGSQQDPTGEEMPLPGLEPKQEPEPLKAKTPSSARGRRNAAKKPAAPAQPPSDADLLDELLSQ